MRTRNLVFAAVAFAAASAPAAAQDIGVAACDAFLKSYESCIGTNVPPAQQGQMKSLLEQVRTNWKTVGATADGRAQIETMCRQTADAIKQQTASLGCKW